jgi:hypothetical protein
LCYRAYQRGLPPVLYADRKNGRFFCTFFGGQMRSLTVLLRYGFAKTKHYPPQSLLTTAADSALIWAEGGVGTARPNESVALKVTAHFGRGGGYFRLSLCLLSRMYTITATARAAASITSATASYTDIRIPPFGGRTVPYSVPRGRAAPPREPCLPQAICYTGRRPAVKAALMGQKHYPPQSLLTTAADGALIWTEGGAGTARLAFGNF